MNLFNKINIPLFCFLSFSIRIIGLGPSLVDAAALLVFALLYGFNTFLTMKHVEVLPINEEVKKDIENLKASIGAVKISQSQLRR